MNLLTTRIELGQGDYALAYRDLLRKTARQIQAVYRSHMEPCGKPLLLSEVQAGTSLINDFKVDIAKLDPDEIAEIFILNQVPEWSFGTVNKDTLDNIPAAKYELLKGELDRLYTPAPLAGKPADG